MDEFPIVYYANSIGKNTAQLTLWDMLKFYSWLQKKFGKHKGGEQKVYRIEKIVFLKKINKIRSEKKWHLKLMQRSR